MKNKNKNWWDDYSEIEGKYVKLYFNKKRTVWFYLKIEKRAKRKGFWKRVFRIGGNEIESSLYADKESRDYSLDNGKNFPSIQVASENIVKNFHYYRYFVQRLLDLEDHREYLDEKDYENLTYAVLINGIQGLMSEAMEDYKSALERNQEHVGKFITEAIKARSERHIDVLYNMPEYREQLLQEMEKRAYEVYGTYRKRYEMEVLRQNLGAGLAEKNKSKKMKI